MDSSGKIQLTEKIIAAGSGGQGIMLLGKLLAEAGMRAGQQVTWLPSYGAEVRGGTANCMIIISKEEIASPYVETADTLIVMNQLSLEKFSSRLKPGGILLYNSSLASVPRRTGIDVRGYPFSEKAVSAAGSMKAANMVALGAYVAIKNIVSVESVLDIVKQQKRELLEMNKKALLAGIALVK
ncbi:MAG: 2-oxoacid:acceptor oxidoreductase family protein [Candidatus Omnitrophota bacterium]|jgi:2-oxoglutarate ferredoxin oxidoreductase subunit gamma